MEADISSPLFGVAVAPCCLAVGVNVVVPRWVDKNMGRALARTRQVRCPMRTYEV